MPPSTHKELSMKYLISNDSEFKAVIATEFVLGAGGKILNDITDLGTVVDCTKEVAGILGLTAYTSPLPEPVVIDLGDEDEFSYGEVEIISEPANVQARSNEISDLQLLMDTRNTEEIEELTLGIA
jgi:hypothetical protein